MSRFSAYLRSKTEWWKRYRDEATRLKWIEESEGTEWKVTTSSYLNKELGVVLSRQQVSHPSMLASLGHEFH